VSQDLAPSFDPNIQVANDCPRIMFFWDPNAIEINTKAMLAMHNTFLIEMLLQSHVRKPQCVATNIYCCYFL